MCQERGGIVIFKKKNKTTTLSISLTWETKQQSPVWKYNQPPPYVDSHFLINSVTLLPPFLSLYLQL